MELEPTFTTKAEEDGIIYVGIELGGTPRERLHRYLRQAARKADVLVGVNETEEGFEIGFKNEADFSVFMKRFNAHVSEHETLLNDYAEKFAHHYDLNETLSGETSHPLEGVLDFYDYGSVEQNSRLQSRRQVLYFRELEARYSGEWEQLDSEEQAAISNAADIATRAQLIAAYRAFGKNRAQQPDERTSHPEVIDEHFEAYMPPHEIVGERENKLQERAERLLDHLRTQARSTDRDRGDDWDLSR